MKTIEFDQYGNFTGTIPEECVQDCATAGPVDSAVAHWVKKLEFDVPEPMAAKWLAGFGAWEADELLDHEANARRVLWLACGDLKEQGEWIGLVN